MVTSYVLGLASVVREAGGGNEAPIAFDVLITDLDCNIHVETTDDGAATASFSESGKDPRVSGRAGELVDFVTGRSPQELPTGDTAALRRLHRLAELMA